MKIKWQPIFTAKTPTLFQWYIFEGEMEKYFKDVLNLNVAYTNGKNVLDEIFYDSNELVGMEKRLSREIGPHPNFINRYISICYQKCGHLITISRQLGKIKSLNRLEDEELLTFYKKYQEAVFETMPFMTTLMVIDRIFKKKMTYLLESENAIKNKAEQNLLISKLIIPIKKNFFVKEQDNLLRMALKLQENEDFDINPEIEKHLAQYAWTTTSVYLGALQTKRNVMKKIQILLKKNPREELEKIKQIKDKARKEYEKAYCRINKSKNMNGLINYARQLLFLQTHKMETLYLAHFYAGDFLEEIGNRFGLSLGKLIYLTGDEIVGLLNKTWSLDNNELKARMKSVSIIKEHNHITLYSGGEIKRTTQKVTSVTTVKGTIACQGSAVGKAKLLFEVGDMEKIKKGDIIVSPMTRPHFVPVMKKAVGIITDFGGILCHAAIISREFGIPCIVGTKEATKIFKDGDLIELNAYEGFAKKL